MGRVWGDDGDGSGSGGDHGPFLERELGIQKVLVPCLGLGL